MKTYRLQIVTPDRMFFDGQVERLTVRTANGDLGVLANHANYVSVLGTGKLKFTTEEGKQRIAAVSGGFIKVDKESTTVVATTCEYADEIDIDRAKLAAEQAEEQIKLDLKKKERKVQELKLKKALNRIDIASEK